jgi:hypothetical protein
LLIDGFSKALGVLFDSAGGSIIITPLMPGLISGKLPLITAATLSV